MFKSHDFSVNLDEILSENYAQKVIFLATSITQDRTMQLAVASFSIDKQSIPRTYNVLILFTRGTLQTETVLMTMRMNFSPQLKLRDN